MGTRALAMGTRALAMGTRALAIITRALAMGTRAAKFVEWLSWQAGEVLIIDRDGTILAPAESAGLKEHDIATPDQLMALKRARARARIAKARR
jgi:hypothetical protein